MFIRFFLFFFTECMVSFRILYEFKQRRFSVYHQNDIVLCVCVCVYMGRRLAVSNRQHLLLKLLTTPF
jgi:hypothetical protein